jgi:DNA-nicking Smr family endonuclease
LDIDGRIDLHGMTQAVAKPMLAAFLRNLSANQGRCGLVITGKGRPDAIIDDYYAPPPGVLRRSFPEWLNDPALSPLIAGWAPAHSKHGGSGAFYVLLKRVVKK